MVQNQSNKNSGKFPDSKLSLDADSIKQAIWHEGKTPEENKYMRYLMRKMTQGEGLAGQESDDYCQAYRRIYSRRYRKLNRRRLNVYHNSYRKTHKEIVRHQQYNYRHNPNNGYQAHAHKRYHSKEYREYSKRLYHQRYPDGPDQKRRDINRESFRRFYARHPDWAHENSIKSRRRKAGRPDKKDV